MIEIGLFILPMSIVIMIGQIIVMLNYRRFPGTKVVISDVDTQKIISGNLIKLLGSVTFMLDDKTRIEEIGVTETLRNERRVDDLMRQLNDLRGKEVIFYRVPYFRTWGYFDVIVLRKPMWPIFVGLIAVIVPYITLLQSFPT